MSSSWFPASPRLHLSGPAALVEAVPYLLGFRPRESVVAVVLRNVSGATPRVVATARADLAASSVLALHGFVCRVAELGGERVVVLAYGGTHPDAGASGVLTWTSGQRVDDLAAAAAVAASFAAQDIEVVDLLVVEEMTGDPGAAGWRWRSGWCENPSCCPVNGRFVPDGGVVSTQAVGLGLTALPTRHDLEAELVPDLGLADQVSGFLGHREVAGFADDAQRSEEVAALRSAIDADRAADRLDPAVAARFLHALTDVHVRDAAAVLGPRRGSRGHRQAALRRAQRMWHALTCAAPVGWAAPPATLLAMTTYRLGDGARANSALDRALADDPVYSLAQLMEQALLLAIPPDELEAIWLRSARLKPA